MNKETWLGLSRECKYEFDAVLTEKGNLALVCTEDYAEEIRYFYENAYHKDHSVLADLLDGFQANGRFYPINPQHVFVGLTDAPVISSDLEYTNDGDAYIPGAAQVWWFPQYETTSFAEELVRTGKVVFQRAPS